MDRDTLRSAAFKNPSRKRIKFTYGGQDFELLSPTVGVRKKISHKTKASIGERDMSFLDMAEWVAIYCTVVPGTDTLLFEESDHATFENMEMEGFLDTVAPYVGDILNMRGEEEKKPSENA